jgi:hypothetical protein
VAGLGHQHSLVLPRQPEDAAPEVLS